MTAVVVESASRQAATAPDRRSGAARWAILVGFVAVVAVTMWRHEMWRDELQAWMIARGSTSLRDLAYNVRYEGHPLLWYAILFPLTRIGAGPWPMQALQLVVATATMALVIWRAPFTLLQKALFAGGYFVVFEYGVLSRSYALGFLCVAVVCTLAGGRPRQWTLLGACLALLALTSAFGTLLALAFGAGLGVDETIRRRRADPDVASPQSLAVGAAVALAGVLLAYAQAMPPRGSGVYRGWTADLDTGLAGSALASVWRAIVPIPRFNREFWNTNALDGHVGVTAIFGLLLLALVAWTVRRHPGAMIVWAAGAMAVIMFLYEKIGYAGASRHYGHIFIVLVATMWLAPATAALGSDPQADDAAAVTRAALWTGILTVQVVAGLFAVTLDLAGPFSNGRDVARYLEREHLTDALIVGDPDVSASTVAAYLDRDVYYPAGGRFGQFIIWDKERIEPGEPLQEALRRFAAGAQDPLLLLVTHPLNIDEDAVPLRLLATFDDGIVSDEHFWLYRVVPPDAAPAQPPSGRKDRAGN